MRIELSELADVLIVGYNGTFRLAFHPVPECRAGFRALLAHEGWEVSEIRLPVESPDPELPRTKKALVNIAS